MKRTVIVSLLAVAVAASGIFTGCGSGKPEAKRPVNWQVSGPAADAPKTPAAPANVPAAPKESVEEIFKRLLKERDDDAKRIGANPGHAPLNDQGWKLPNLREADYYGEPQAVAEKYFGEMVAVNSARNFKKTYQADANMGRQLYYSVEIVVRWSEATERLLFELTFEPNKGPKGEAYLASIRLIERADPNYQKYLGN